MRSLRREGDDLLQVRTLIHAAGDFTELTTGTAPSEGDVRALFDDLPPGRNLDDKFVLGFFEGPRLLGVADVVRGWNAPEKVIIGLLLFHPDARGQGHGRTALQKIVQLAETWPQANRLRIGVVATHAAALSFWRQMGFTETGEIRPRTAPYVADILVFEKPLRTEMK